MAAATKDGLPRKAFAYAPTADPSTWKLPFRKADGSPDPDRLPAAAAALSEGGHRGEKADIPGDMLAMVKAKLRSGYRRWKGSDVDYPASIKESEVALRESEGDEAVVIREATILLDKSAVQATVIAAPNGDMLVIPCWNGQFTDLAKPYEEPTPASDAWQSSYDVSDAAQAVATLTRLRNHELGQPEQVAMLDAAINGLANFIKAEATETTEAIAESAGRAALATLQEAGKRNSSSDQKLIQQGHDLFHDLGAEHTPGKSYKGMQAALAESAVYQIDPASGRAEIAFAEASGDGQTLVLLSEAAAVFDKATQTVTITPIRPGFGNKRDGMYYPTDTLREATEAGLFDNLKMYRNHPRKSDDKERPERDVNDWFATTRKATWDESIGAPRLPVKVHDDKDFARWEDAPEQIAFSVRGGGFARKGTAEGQDTKIVEAIARVRSVDWVTEAGAGGAITFAESAASEEFEMDLKTLSTDQLKEELRLREAADGAVAEPPTKAEAEPPAEPDPAPAPEPTPEPAPEPEAKIEVAVAPTGFVSQQAFDDLRAKVEAREKADADAAAAAETKTAASKAIEAEVSESLLPKAVKDVVVAQFAESSWGGGSVYTDEPAFRGAVKGALTQAAALLAAAGKGPSPVKGLGTQAGAEAVSVSESVRDRIAKRWGQDTHPAPMTLVIPADELAGSPRAAAPRTPTGDGEPEQISEAASASSAVGDRLARRFGV